MRLTLALGAMLPTLTLAGLITVHNSCTNPVYLYAVSSTRGPEQTLKPGYNYSETYQYDPKTGVALKIFTAPGGLTGPFPQLNIAYSLVTPRIW